MKKDLTSIMDVAQDISKILKLSKDFEEKFHKRETHEILKGKTIALLFEKPSTRTRVSFEVAIAQLGGHSFYLSWQDLQLTRGETVEDTARVLSKYINGIVIRSSKHETITEFAKHATVTVINGLSNLEHPCQILSDLFTILERKGQLRGLNLAWIGDGNNVCNSLLLGCAITGVNVKVACPRGYEPLLVEKAEQLAKISGASIEILTNPVEAIQDADIVYTDTWISMGTESEAEKRLNIFPPYQVNKKLVSHAKKDYIFMHCLPAHRGQEVTSDIIDDPIHSVVWYQAENKLHAQKAVLTFLLSQS